MLFSAEDIKQTARGYRVDKKIAGHPRLRKTFATYDEAAVALDKYMRGEGATSAATSGKTLVTWREVYDNAARRRWRYKKTTTQMDNARRTIEKYLGWDGDVRRFDQAAADRLSDQLENDLNSLTTVSHRLSAVRVMLDEALERDIITWTPPKLMHHAQTETRINFFDYDMESLIVNILRQSQRGEFADLFIVLIETGMRTAEGMYLKWRDVDMDARLIRIWGDGTKTGKSRRVPISQRCMDVLKQRKEANEGVSDRVFPSATKSSMRWAWEVVRKATGNDDKDFVWYTTRHTCASRLIRAGVDVKTVQTWLGHNRIETTMRYIQFSTGSLYEGVDALDRARANAEGQKKSA